MKKFSSSGSTLSNTYPDNGLVEGTSPDLVYGERLPAEYAAKLPNPIPAIDTIKGKRGKLPADIMVMGDGLFSHRPLVSDRLRSAIEFLEPGKHQFLPVTFVNGDGEPPEPIWNKTPWWYFNLLNWCEAESLFNIEAMTPDVVQTITRPDGRQVIGFTSYKVKEFVVRADFLERNIRRDLFVTSSYFKRDLTYVRIHSALFCTGRARQHFKDAGLKGGRFLELRIV